MSTATNRLQALASGISGLLGLRAMEAAIEIDDWRPGGPKLGDQHTMRGSPLASLSESSWKGLTSIAPPKPAVVLESSPSAAAPPRSPRPATIEKGTLRCITTPVAVVPQRHWTGLYVQGRLALSAQRSASRGQLVHLRVPREQLCRFDRAVLGRAVSMIETHAADLIDRDVIVDASLSALQDGELLRRMGRLSANSLARDVRLVLSIGGEEARRLPHDLSGFPQNLVLAVRIGDPAKLDPGLFASGAVGQATVQAARLRGRTDVPFESDPIHRGLSTLDAAEISLLATGVHEEASLLDVLDYPIGQATGRLFGRTGVIMSDGSCTHFTFNDSEDAQQEEVAEPALASL